MTRTLVVAAALVLLPGALIAATYRVAPDGSGDFPNIQAAVVSVASGDSILLEDGVYTGPGNRDILFPARDIVLRSGSGEPSLCTLDCEGSSGNPHRAFVMPSGGEPIIEGITIQNGYLGGEYDLGGAILCSSTSPRFRNCRFIANHASEGGAAYFRDGSRPRFEDCRFLSNSCDFTGGAILCFYAGLELIGCEFVDNRSSDLIAGAVQLVSNPTPTLIVDCVFEGNYARANTGALALGDGAGHSVRSTRFIDNATSGTIGGAVSAYYCGVSFLDCEFVGNHCDDPLSAGSVGGGAIRLLNVSATFMRCLFAGNTAAGLGGAIAAYSSALGMNRCTFAANAGGVDAGGILLDSGGMARSTLSHSIIAFSSAGGAIGCPSGADVTLTCCDIYGNVGGDWDGCIEGQLGVAGNFSGDPRFCGEANPDSPWSLREDSPCAPANNADCGLIGVYDAGCGTTALGETSWSALKSLY